ncbi:MAG: hypothetical protein E7406_04355 [Ruminococcaceae bacterium]|nr:hypothetical protein [Oscillospiraceae bacterium]
MSLNETIDKILEKMQNTPLSIILPLILPVSLQCKDYEGYCVLTYWGRPLCKEKEGNQILQDEMIALLSQEGLDAKTIATLLRESFEKFLSMRTIDKNQVLTFCAKEMEAEIKNYDDLLTAVEPPEGLAPLDLYYRSKAATEGKITIIKGRQRLEKQYAILQAYLTSKLLSYKRKVNLEERKNVLKNRISDSKDIFIIHGHNEAKRRELEALIKEKFNLNPIVLAEQPDQGLTIIEKFEKYALNCAYAFALFTPDDIVTNNGEQYFQARPNVIFELGWFYANLGRSRVCILDQESEKSKVFSDLKGVMRMQFKNNISEKYIEIERELKSVGVI